MGLTVEPQGKFSSIIESRPRQDEGGIPVYGEGADVAEQRELRDPPGSRRERRPERGGAGAGALKGEQGDIIVFAPTRTR